MEFRRSQRTLGRINCICADPRSSRRHSLQLKLRKSFCPCIFVTLVFVKIVPKAVSEFLSGFSSVIGYLLQAAFGTISRITGGFRNNFLSIRRLSENRSKLPEEGYWKAFQKKQVILEASRNLIFVFSKTQPKIVKPSALIQRLQI